MMTSRSQRATGRFIEVARTELRLEAGPPPECPLRRSPAVPKPRKMRKKAAFRQGPPIGEASSLPPDGELGSLTIKGGARVADEELESPDYTLAAIRFSVNPTTSFFEVAMEDSVRFELPPTLDVSGEDWSWHTVQRFSLPVPEPSSLVLLVVGLIGVITWSRLTESRRARSLALSARQLAIPILLGAQFVASNISFAQQPTPSFAQAPIVASAPAQSVKNLEAQVDHLSKEIQRLSGEISSVRSGNYSAMISALGIFAAASIAGYFAFKNQREQTARQSSLKAIELIISSRSGYEAKRRFGVLSQFVEPTLRSHLEEKVETLSSSETASIYIALAKAASDKVTTAQEVVDVWKKVMKKWEFFGEIDHLANTETDQSA